MFPKRLWRSLVAKQRNTDNRDDGRHWTHPASACPWLGRPFHCNGFPTPRNAYWFFIGRPELLVPKTRTIAANYPRKFFRRTQHPEKSMPRDFLFGCRTRKSTWLLVVSPPMWKSTLPMWVLYVSGRLKTTGRIVFHSTRFFFSWKADVKYYHSVYFTTAKRPNSSLAFTAKSSFQMQRKSNY